VSKLYCRDRKGLQPDSYYRDLNPANECLVRFQGERPSCRLPRSKPLATAHIISTATIHVVAGQANFGMFHLESDQPSAATVRSEEARRIPSLRISDGGEVGLRALMLTVKDEEANKRILATLESVLSVGKFLVGNSSSDGKRPLLIRNLF
jgi:hypothetical protein